MNIKKFIPAPIKGIILKKISRIHKMYYIVEAVVRPSKAIYYCPCCNHKLVRFISGPYNKMPQLFDPERYKNTIQEVSCPICGVIPRHRILVCWLKKHKAELNGKILYFACERGIRMWMDRNNIRYTTADLFADADLKLDIQNTRLPDNSWDWIICNHVLEHVDDYKQALKEIYRILKPGGTLICSFPILESLPILVEETEHTEENKAKRIQLYGQFDHLRIFGADSEKMLKKAGFLVSRIEGEKCPESILPVVGPADYDVNYLFVCRKPKEA